MTADEATHSGPHQAASEYGVYAADRIDALRNLRREGYAVVEKEALDALMGDNCLLQDEVERLRGVLAALSALVAAVDREFDGCEDEELLLITSEAMERAREVLRG